MSRKTGNIMRNIRVQLKTGFMKTEPPEYTFMKRYPPMHRDGQPKFYEVQEKKVPYLDLMEKAASVNPLYGDRIYPAYWQDEPVGLTLAKKQYQCMMNGDDEESAFRKAELYIDELENKSYVRLKKIREVLAESRASAPFMQDATLVKDITKWQEILKNVPYNQLLLSDQGEVDHLIQTRILKWSEGERERRMKDPMFQMQFDQLREVLFPNEQEAARVKKEDGMLAKQRFLSTFHLNYDDLKASFPFYLEDYIKWFAKLSEESDTAKWSIRDRSDFKHYVQDTLAYHHHKRGEEDDISHYLNCLKYQYFPMTRPTDTPDKYTLPTVDSLRRILYENEIGYKKQGGKVFVKRFYKIPALLFPLDTLMATVISAMDPEDVEAEVSNMEKKEKELLDEIRAAGMSDDSMPKVLDQLRKYAAKCKLPMPDYGAQTASGSSASFLDDIIGDALADRTSSSKKRSTFHQLSHHDTDHHDTDSEEDEEGMLDKYIAAERAKSQEANTATPTTTTATSELTDSDHEDEVEDGEVEPAIELVARLMAERRAKAGLPPVDSSEDYDDDSDEESDDSDGECEMPVSPEVRAQLMEKYVKPATTELERDRSVFMAEQDDLPLHMVNTETDFQMFQAMRLEQDIKDRARAEYVYEQKESARRRKDWKQRHVFNMPRPALPVVGIYD